ncbi:MAG: HupE/UreJ family protein [Pseudomonadota bacterium]
MSVRGVMFRALALVLVALFVGAVSAWAHPEDEFCVPGQSALDPTLCEALAALDSVEGGRSLSPEAESLLADLENRSAVETFLLYVYIGFQHILPMGLDHILFVIGLVLSTPRLRQLALQISAFTIAHTATLGLAATGMVDLPAEIVEPLIAASIAFVAIEAIFLREPPPWRLAVVFLFGLIHGLGFAGAFGELGLPATQFWPGLIGFNVGVEVGQITVALAGLAALWAASRIIKGPEKGYPNTAVWPAAIMVAATGAFWTIERVWSALSMV